MTESEAEIPQIDIGIGEAHLARGPAILRTVLGSCVGVTFWSPRLGVGALCHGVLPSCRELTSAVDGYRFVEFAIRDLARKLDALGIHRSEVQIKVFGGADMFPAGALGPPRIAVGDKNWRMAMEVLRDERFIVNACDVGGSAGRVIQLNTVTGRVHLRRLSPVAKPAACQAISRKEPLCESCTFPCSDCRRILNSSQICRKP